MALGSAKGVFCSIFCFRKVVECILQILSGKSNLRLCNIACEFRILLKQAFASFCNLKRLRKDRRCTSVINSSIRATLSALQLDRQPYRFSPRVLVASASRVDVFGQNNFKRKL